MTFTGGYVSGKEYSADIFGQTVSIIADDNDGFENSLNGLVNQMTQAINDAGIIGVASADTANTRVSLTAFAEVTNARVTKDQGTVDATISVDKTDGWNDKDVSITLGGAIEKNGDTFEFEVNGTLIEMKIGADGFQELRCWRKIAVESCDRCRKHRRYHRI